MDSFSSCSSDRLALSLWHDMIAISTPLSASRDLCLEYTMFFRIRRICIFEYILHHIFPKMYNLRIRKICRSPNTGREMYLGSDY